MGEVAELSQGRVKLKIGSLYGVLDRLAGEGLIEPDRDEVHDGRVRRYYRLTRAAIWSGGTGGCCGFCPATTTAISPPGSDT